LKICGAAAREALAGTFNAQGVANMLWAYATMGRVPGGGGAGGLVHRAGSGKHAVGACDGAGARGGTDEGAGGAGGVGGGHVQRADVANTLLAACMFSVLRAPGE
jgi:hypothetical protein